jgi:hypothetical protein
MNRIGDFDDYQVLLNDLSARMTVHQPGSNINKPASYQPRSTKKLIATFGSLEG